ncbi:MAG: hypothetical protein LBD88_00130 [Candidatus Peribacteria bacterium]|jgi:hypothetical protein|nr:hypothetical protein [Candidatus Peribacteria bacterium]
MTDIYDIKDIVFPLPVSVFNTVLVIVIFLIIYFLLFKRSHPSFLLSKEEEQDQKTDYRGLINEFEKNYMSLNSSNFLKETSFIFRGFLEQDL